MSQPIDIRFAPGASSATMSGAVHEPDLDKYRVRGAVGQILTVHITSDENNARFSLSHAGEAPGSIVLMCEDGAGLLQWSGDYPVEGVVEIVVGPERGGAAYDLTVSITGTAI